MKQLIILCFLFIILDCQGQKENSFPFNEFGLAFHQKAFVGGFNNSGFGLNLRHYRRTEKIVNLWYGVEYNFFRQFRQSLSQNPTSSGIIQLSNVQMNFHSLTIPIGLNFKIVKSPSLNISLDLGAYFDLYFLSKLKATQTITTYELQNNNWTTVITVSETIQSPFSVINGGVLVGVKFELPKEKYGFSLRPEFRFAPLSVYESDYLENSFLGINIGLMMNKSK